MATCVTREYAICDDCRENAVNVYYSDPAPDGALAGIEAGWTCFDIDDGGYFTRAIMPCDGCGALDGLRYDVKFHYLSN